MTTTTIPLDSPIGPLVLESDSDVLIGIWLPPATGRRSRDSGDIPPVLKETATQLEEYFAGERTEFDVPMELDGTEFQRAVWAELARIPYGETISYGELARRVGRPKGPRAVGQANGRNPIPIIVPCHRVLASNGIGGYGGGLPMKRALLAVEGVTACAWDGPAVRSGRRGSRGRRPPSCGARSPRRCAERRR
jgi:methylated-DNA-[protein]-cysteine S-methyltransferase